MRLHRLNETWNEQFLGRPHARRPLSVLSMTSNPIAEHKQPLNESTVQLLLVDVQPETMGHCKTNNRESVAKAIVGMAQVARLFKLPVTASLMQMEPKTTPKLIPELEGAFENLVILPRTTINPLDDPATKKRVEELGRHDLVVFGVVSELSVLLAVFTGVVLGHEVHVPVDACSGYSQRTEEAAFRRIESFGAATAASVTLASVLQPDIAARGGHDIAEILTQLMS
jgi:nicotinamidase-related amidase